ncbi:MAG TPA: ABC transporter ATP-binding protein [Anaerolineales bacterium]|jgi:spermidine/putrescine transport system ATP-binding protein
MSEFAVELQDVVKTFQTPEGGHINAVDHVDMKIKNGEFFSLLGSSGCGKTTSLRMMAGFEWPTEGEVFIEGEPQGHKPPFQRPVNTVFQSYALFQHMNVYQNVAFGLEMEQAPQNEIKERVGRALEMVKLTGLDRRSPRQLSGGQQQRVALARALVKLPSVLLLDEPLGALDLKLRKEMQLELKTLQREVGITFVFVTHDQEEALTMSDRIAVMSLGKVLQVGSPVEIYERPNRKFVADFIGDSNFLEGEVREVVGDKVSVFVPKLGAEINGMSQNSFSTGDKVVISIRPEKIRLSEKQVTNQNCFEVRVTNSAYIGSDTRLEVDARGVKLKVWEQNHISTLDPRAYHQGEQKAFVNIFPENALVLPFE